METSCCDCDCFILDAVLDAVLDAALGVALPLIVAFKVIEAPESSVVQECKQGKAVPQK
jgi:hypothetical protein